MFKILKLNWVLLWIAFSSLLNAETSPSKHISLVLGNAYDSLARNNQLYVLSNFGVVSYSVTSSESIKEIWRIPLIDGGESQGKMSLINNRYLYVITNQSIYVIDILNSSQPKLLSETINDGTALCKYKQSGKVAIPDNLRCSLLDIGRLTHPKIMSSSVYHAVNSQLDSVNPNFPYITLNNNSLQSFQMATPANHISEVILGPIINILMPIVAKYPNKTVAQVLQTTIPANVQSASYSQLKTLLLTMVESHFGSTQINLIDLLKQELNSKGLDTNTTVGQGFSKLDISPYDTLRSLTKQSIHNMFTNPENQPIIQEYLKKMVIDSLSYAFVGKPLAQKDLLYPLLMSANEAEFISQVSKNLLSTTLAGIDPEQYVSKLLLSGLPEELSTEVKNTAIYKFELNINGLSIGVPDLLIDQALSFAKINKNNAWFIEAIKFYFKWVEDIDLDLSGQYTKVLNESAEDVLSQVYQAFSPVRELISKVDSDQLTEFSGFMENAVYKLAIQSLQTAKFDTDKTLITTVEEHHLNLSDNLNTLLASLEEDVPSLSLDKMLQLNSLSEFGIPQWLAAIQSLFPEIQENSKIEELVAMLINNINLVDISVNIIEGVLKESLSEEAWFTIDTQSIVATTINPIGAQLTVLFSDYCMSLVGVLGPEIAVACPAAGVVAKEAFMYSLKTILWKSISQLGLKELNVKDQLKEMLMSVSFKKVYPVYTPDNSWEIVSYQMLAPKTALVFERKNNQYRVNNLQLNQTYKSKVYPIKIEDAGFTPHISIASSQKIDLGIHEEAYIIGATEQTVVFFVKSKGKNYTMFLNNKNQQSPWELSSLSETSPLLREAKLFSVNEDTQMFYFGTPQLTNVLTPSHGLSFLDHVIFAGGNTSLSLGKHSFKGLTLINNAQLSSLEQSLWNHNIDLKVSKFLHITKGSALNVSGVSSRTINLDDPETINHMGNLTYNYGYGGITSQNMNTVRYWPYDYRQPIWSGVASSQNKAGGAVKLSAPYIDLEGDILANGQNSEDYLDMEATGGGIIIETDTLVGSGFIKANALSNANAAGGGMIAIYYRDMSYYPLNHIQTFGSREANTYSSEFAGCGTVFLKSTKQTYGDLLLDNGNVPAYQATTPLRSLGKHSISAVGKYSITLDLNHSLPIEDSINGFKGLVGMTFMLNQNSSQVFTIVKNNQNTIFIDSASGIDLTKLAKKGQIIQGVQQFDNIIFRGKSNATTTDAVIVYGNGSHDSGNLTIEASMKAEEWHFVHPNLRQLTISSAIIEGNAFKSFQPLDVEIIQQGTLSLRGKVLFNTLRLLDAGRFTQPLITHHYQRTEVTVIDSVFVDSTSAIDVGGVSEASLYFEDESYGGIEFPSGSYGGLMSGSYNYFPSNWFFDYKHPQWSATVSGIKSGGGALWLSTPVLEVNGYIRANGVESPDYQTGGSGGGIELNVAQLKGSGYIQANGTSDTSYSYGGGMIAIYYETMSAFPISHITAFGGNGEGAMNYQVGGAGTVFLKSLQQTYGDLIIDNGGYEAENDSTPIRSLSSYTISSVGKDYVVIDSNQGANLIKPQLDLQVNGQIGLSVIINDHLQKIFTITNNTNNTIYLNTNGTDLRSQVKAGDSLQGITQLDKYLVRNGAKPNLLGKLAAKVANL